MARSNARNTGPRVQHKDTVLAALTAAQKPMTASQKIAAQKDTPSGVEIIMIDVESGASVRAGKGAVTLAGAVPLDEARRLFDAGWKAAALFCDREDVVADGIIGFGAGPQFEAAFSAANGIKHGGHHD